MLPDTVQSSPDPFLGSTDLEGPGALPGVLPPRGGEGENEIVPHPDASSTPPEDPLQALRRSPEYRRDAKFVELLDRLENGQFFYEIDNHYGGGLGAGLGDRLLSLGDLRAAAGDPQASPELRGLAQAILDNPGLWALLDSDGNQVVSADALKDRLQGLKARLAAMEEAVLHPSTTGPAGEGSTVDGGSGASCPPPLPGPRTTDMAAGLNALQSQLDDLDGQINEAARKQPPDMATITSLQSQRQQLVLAQQVLTSIMTQQFDAISNQLKQLSEMARTAIGNIR